MKRAILVICLVSLTLIKSSATWSIIVADPKTGAIGIAGASCTPSVYGIGAIVPGKGAIIVQAMSNGAARMQGVRMIEQGNSPAEILDVLMDRRFYPLVQQYAIVTLKQPDSIATYTGDSCRGFKGALTAKGISVQGNMLTSDDVLRKVMAAALEAQQAGLPLQEILMRALEAGANAGGDRRCGEYKASSAFITIAEKDDKDQQPRVDIVVNKEDDNTNAVQVLRKRVGAYH